ncbi:MAG: glycosyltransferase [Candidatus Omnitrophota bacterium]|nr:glycosyltransferase [Candidatus Omnitrophota bacterium]
MNFCVVSPEFPGTFNTDDLALACGDLTDRLLSQGHHVHWLRTHSPSPVSVPEGVTLHILPIQPPVRNYHNALHLVESYEVLQWLKSRSFDEVVFALRGGLGYYSLIEKSQGESFAETRLNILVTSPTLCRIRSNHEFLTIPDLYIHYTEKRSVELADLIVSTSRSVDDWMRDQDWELPNKSQIWNLPMSFSQHESSAEIGSPNEVVFLGRLETAAGLAIFCDAVEMIAGIEVPLPFSVTFLGDSGQERGVDGADYVRTRARDWQFEWRIQSGWEHSRVIDYLKDKGRLAVLPFLDAPPPYLVRHLLECGIHFLTSRLGEIPDLIRAEDAGKILFDPVPSDIARILSRAVTKTAAAPRPKTGPRETTVWPSKIESQPISPVNSSSLVSICLIHRNRAAYLQQALEHLERQDYKSYEIILVDDGSTVPSALSYLHSLSEKFQSRGWTLIRQPNRHIGAARNRAADNAKGKYLLFHDDDNTAKPHCLTSLVRIAEATNAAVVTCAHDRFEEDNGKDLPPMRWLPLGGDPVSGMFRNCYGDAQALVRRDVFYELGGFSEDFGCCHEDWEFFQRVAIKGFRFEVTPESLYDYRVSGEGNLDTNADHSHFQATRPYFDLPAPFKELAFAVQSLGSERLRLQKDISFTAAALRKAEHEIVELRKQLDSQPHGFEEARNR